MSPTVAPWKAPRIPLSACVIGNSHEHACSHSGRSDTGKSTPASSVAARLRMNCVGVPCLKRTMIAALITPSGTVAVIANTTKAASAPRLTWLKLRPNRLPNASVSPTWKNASVNAHAPAASTTSETLVGVASTASSVPKT